MTARLRDLTDEQNERVRDLVRELLRREGNSQTSLAPRLGMRQPALSGFLARRQGTSYAMATRAHPSSSALALAEALLGPARLVPREAIASGAALAADGLLVAADADADETDEALARLAVRAWVGPLPSPAEREISRALLARLSAPPASGFRHAV